MDLKTEEKQATLVALCSEKKIVYCFRKIGFLTATHPPQSRLSLMAEHQVAVFGSASLRKSIQVSEPAVDMGKRKSLNASLKQWHFFSE